MTTAIAPPREAVAFDLEGGLANVTRIHRLAGDASRFYQAILKCPANRDVVRAAKEAHKSGKTVIVMTGGDHRFAPVVAQWLARHRVPSTRVLMRGRGDYRPSAVVKLERLCIAHRQFPTLTVWSADPGLAHLSEQEGITVTKLPGYWGDAL